MHDGIALHLQAEQWDSCEAFPPSSTCCHKWRLSPRLAALPQQGTTWRERGQQDGRGDGRMGERMAGWRGDGYFLIFHHRCRGTEWGGCKMAG